MTLILSLACALSMTDVLSVTLTDALDISDLAGALPIDLELTGALPVDLELPAGALPVNLTLSQITQERLYY